MNLFLYIDDTGYAGNELPFKFLGDVKKNIHRIYS